VFKRRFEVNITLIHDIYLEIYFSRIFLFKEDDEDSKEEDEDDEHLHHISEFFSFLIKIIF